MCYRSMKMRIMLMMTALMTFVSFQAASADHILWAPPLLSQIIEEGLAGNNEIQAMESQIAGLKEQIPLAGSLKDPTERLPVGLPSMPLVGI